jgi:VanZ family protein
MGAVQPLPRFDLPRRVAAGALAVYLVALVLIAFWPHHIDRDADALLRAIERILPWATHSRVEFASNIALFVPLGFLLTALLRHRVIAVIAIGLGMTVVIELAQAAFLPGRTSSVLDVVANTLGTLIGLAAFFTLTGVRRARRESEIRRAHRESEIRRAGDLARRESDIRENPAD